MTIAITPCTTQKSIGGVEKNSNGCDSIFVSVIMFHIIFAGNRSPSPLKKRGTEQLPLLRLEYTVL